MTDIQTALFALRDPAYQAFQSKLIPTIDPQTVIGVRMPALRKLAREIAGTPVAEGFLQELPHRYYEENNLHGLLISAILAMTVPWRRWRHSCPMWTTGPPVTC